MTTSHADIVEKNEGLSLDDGIMLLCWQCGNSLAKMTPETRIGSGTRVCSNCRTTTRYQDGIWRTLSPERSNHFLKFTTEYEFIRSAEGRGSIQPEYYLGLPYQDLSGRNSGQWAIRSRTYHSLNRCILKPLAKSNCRPLRILDLGAGNGWMSYRLALERHLPVAVDLLVNDSDGLGASAHFSSQIQPLFPRVQAELDHLPFASSTFDMVIFNASFHYSENYHRTFSEAVRCTRTGGTIVIADTPWYAQEESGRQMVEEKHKHFAATYGFASNSISSLEYLTPNRLQRLESAFDLKWRTIKPFYGISWSLRPLRAKLSRRRTPSSFRLYATRVNA